MAVVPAYNPGSRANATVPELMLLPFNDVRLAPDTAPKLPDQVPEVMVPTEVKLDAVTPDAKVLPDNVPAAAVTVMSALPLNDTPLMLLAVCNVVAVVALPDKEPVKVEA